MTIEGNTPAADERSSWYTRVSDGQRAKMVSRGGVSYMVLDRPDEETQIPYKAEDWIPDVDSQPLTRAAVAYIAHEADKALCRSIGLHKESRVEWEDILPDDKAKLISEYPMGKPLIRSRVQRAIWQELKRYAR